MKGHLSKRKIKSNKEITEKWKARIIEIYNEKIKKTQAIQIKIWNNEINE